MAIRVAGVGGTGVVTLAHLLARAATLDGLAVWGLDQTGLSQKAGAVVSDLRIGSDTDARSNLLGDGDVDVLLAADLMAAARPSVLLATDESRTALVTSVSTSLSGPMILGGSDRRVPVGELRETVVAACRPGADVVDADALARQSAGTTTVANVVLLGVAAQRGVLPVTIDSLESAIRQNSVAVDQNLAAFRAGRAWAAEAEPPASVAPHERADGKVTWLLHPPLLRGLGLCRKLRLGPWATPLLKALRAARRLRGTSFDPFGHTRLRRIERELPAEYAGAIRTLLPRLDAETLPVSCTN